MENNNKNKYSYMLDMPHYQSKKRKRMPIEDRAAQFGAFRALTGYEEEISKTAQINEEYIEELNKGQPLFD